MQSTRSFRSALLLLWAGLGVAPPVTAQDVAGDFGVFLPVDAGRVSGAAAGPSDEARLVVRARPVGIDFDAFSPMGDATGRGADPAVVRLNLFENVVLESPVESVDLAASGYSWSGGVVGDPTGPTAFAVNGAVVSGVVRTRGRVYTVRSDGPGRYVIREVDRSGLPPGAPPLRPRAATADPMPSAFVDDPDRVDIAVFYTTAARRDAGGTDEFNALLDAWIADVNAAYLRSGIHHLVNLVLRERVSYIEGADSEGDPVAARALECLFEDDDGCLDAVHARREEYSADLVYLIVGGPYPQYQCGIACLTGDFGVAHLPCGSETLAHEIGHNSGVNHDRYQEYDEECDTDPETPCFDDFPSAYAYGYVNQLGLAPGAPRERRWRTLMAYHRQCSEADVYCVRLMRFSNPSQSWHGDVLGVPGTAGPSSYRDAEDAARRGPADAARTHREVAHDLANRVVAPVAGAAPGIERARSGVDRFRAPLVPRIVLVPGVRHVGARRDFGREQLLRDGDGRGRRRGPAVLDVALEVFGAAGCGGRDRGGRAQPRDASFEVRPSVVRDSRLGGRPGVVRFGVLPDARGGIVGEVRDDVRGSFGRQGLSILRLPVVVTRGMGLCCRVADGPVRPRWRRDAWRRFRGRQ